MVYEQPESLKPVAERFKLQIQTTGWITKRRRRRSAARSTTRKLLAALFSSDAMSNKRNTDAIEVAPGTLVAARVLEHQPAAQRKLDEVKDEIAALLRRRRRPRSRSKDGEAKLEQLRKGGAAAASSGARREPCRGAIRRSCRARCCAR